MTRGHGLRLFPEIVFSSGDVVVHQNLQVSELDAFYLLGWRQ